jgi:antitoxin MazE
MEAMIYSYGDVYPAGVKMQVSKWGNSLAVRLPAAVVEALGLKDGDQVEIQVAGKKAFAVAKAQGERELLARLRKFRGRLPKNFKFDRLEANERR